MARARLLLHERVVLDEAVFVEIKVWQVPRSVRSSAHDLKYALALVADRVCVLRYDNEAGKGDHRHTADGREQAYRFRGVDALIEDFWGDVDAWMTHRSSGTD